MKQNYLNTLLYNDNMYNHIILFGSFYMFSISLTLTNRLLLEDKKISKKLFILNGLIMFVCVFC